MNNFNLQYPQITVPQDIERLSLETILKEANQYSLFQQFSIEEQKIIQRMIHSTTCFDEIIKNIVFTDHAITRIKELLQKGASIIVDTSMIKAGLSSKFTEKYNNNVLCYVSDDDVINQSKETGDTRTFIAVKKAIQESGNKPLILACGNAPTFIYGAIEQIVLSKRSTNNISMLVMPVGFVNVLESKEYATLFMKQTNVEGITLQGRYGGSTLVVSSLHAIYKLL